MKHLHLGTCTAWLCPPPPHTHTPSHRLLQLPPDIQIHGIHPGPGPGSRSRGPWHDLAQEGRGRRSWVRAVGEDWIRSYSPMLPLSDPCSLCSQPHAASLGPMLPLLTAPCCLSRTHAPAGAAAAGGGDPACCSSCPPPCSSWRSRGWRSRRGQTHGQGRGQGRKEEAARWWACCCACVPEMATGPPPRQALSPSGQRPASPPAARQRHRHVKRLADMKMA